MASRAEEIARELGLAAKEVTAEPKVLEPVPLAPTAVPKESKERSSAASGDSAHGAQGEDPTRHEHVHHPGAGIGEHTSLEDELGERAREEGMFGDRTGNRRLLGVHRPGAIARRG